LSRRSIWLLPISFHVLFFWLGHGGHSEGFDPHVTIWNKKKVSENKTRIEYADGWALPYAAAGNVAAIVLGEMN
jgi:hypothetical protein